MRLEALTDRVHTLGQKSWRYNGRDNPYLFRDTMPELLKAKALAYKSPTKK